MRHISRRKLSLRGGSRPLRGLLPWALLLSGNLAFAVEASDYQTPGVVGNLPVFYRELIARARYPLSWTTGAYRDFEAWRALARNRVQESLLRPPPAVAWDARVLADVDRGTHVARKVVFNLTGDSRVLAYMTVPKGKGPFPAVLLLHSHDGKFDIGKEKVMRAWGIAPDKLAAADALAAKTYGGRYLGEVLAQRGYVCFATDALNWSDRGGGGYAGQPQLASNLMHLGMSFAGLIAWEDMRAAEFLSQQAEVDPNRIAAMGVSMGAYRTWQLAALSEHVVAGVTICWMSEACALITPENNQVKTASTYSMLHPGLLAQLDYPDVASIACPKPLLVFNGRKDSLFPVDGVERAYAKMHAVWRSQGVEDRLLTRLWDVGHVFSPEMQETAFSWLDEMIRLSASEKSRKSAR